MARLSNRTRQWSELLHWLKRFRADPDFEKEERTYKVALAARVNEARKRIRSGQADWEDAVRRAFTDKDNNLTGWRTHSRFLEWMERESDTCKGALQALWSTTGPPPPPEERLRGFFEQVPGDVLKSLGERLNIGSFLMMAEDPGRLPPVKISPFRKAWKLAGQGGGPTSSEPSAVYGEILRFLDELAGDGAGWPTPLRDRLDAQGAVWFLAKRENKPGGWPTEDWDTFVAWRNGGTPPPTDTDHLAAAAQDLHVDRATIDEIVELLKDKGQVVLYGPPGTGKTFFALRLAKALLKGDQQRSARVQFHPATSYEDFFEGLRPRVTATGQVTYERTAGPLAAIAARAEADPDRRYVLVIDEINRANLPKVFGELLFLLEYRHEPVQTLYRPGEPFLLPRNLWFIGTMNTADRSVALIDAAMRRRFHFVPFFPHAGPMKDLLHSWLKTSGGRIGVAAFLDAVNAELLDLVGEHLLIGPSHFMRADLSDRALERVWTYNVFPLIEEQLWGNVQEIDRWRWEAVRERFAAELASTGDNAG